MSTAAQTVLVLGIFGVAAAVPQGHLVNRWGTNINGGYSARIPSESIQHKSGNGERTQKSANLQPGEAAITNTITQVQQGIGRDVSTGIGNVPSLNQIIPAQPHQSGGFVAQNSKPTTTNVIQNQVGATDLNVSVKPEECYGLPSPGECRGAFPRFFYNSSLDQCDCFLYGGCGDEEIQSSWLTYDDCSTTCSPGNKQEGPRCSLLPEQEIQTFTQPKPEVLHTPDTSHLSDTDLLNAFLG